MFKGDLAKFTPPELLLFLTHLGKEGVLSVKYGDEGLSVSFRDGSLVDAQSDRADAKILRALFFGDLINRDQLNVISRAKGETGLPLRQILESIELPSDPGVRETLDVGIREVLFQLFLLEDGEFQFNAIKLGQYNVSFSYECTTLTPEIAYRAEEYRTIAASVATPEKLPILTSKGRGADANDPALKYVLDQATGHKSVEWIVTTAPFPSYDVMKAIKASLDNGWIEWLNTGHAEKSGENTPTRQRLFFSYKKSLKKILSLNEEHSKVSEIVGFCKNYFGYLLIVATKGDTLVKCTKYSRDDDGRLRSFDVLKDRIGIDEDPIFYWVHRSRLPFFGKLSSSDLFNKLGEKPPNEECAIVPLGDADGVAYLAYVASPTENGEPGPFQYVELFSWHVNPPADERQDDVHGKSATAEETRLSRPPRTICLPQSEDQMTSMVEAVKELPPMPGTVSHILELLTDPDTRIPEIAEALSRDQALVAKVIKVSNSALFLGGERTTTATQAIVKLGIGTIRSLVLAASTRSLFPVGKTNIGIWGQSLWQHSVECGLASRRIADMAGYPDTEEAFIGGILHDIGKVVILLNMPEEFRKVLKKQAAEKKGSVAAEEEVLGFDHTRLGEMLLTEWNMPETLKACVKYHHRPLDVTEHKELVAIISCADHLGHKHGSQLGKTWTYEITDIDALLDTLQISRDNVHVLQGAVNADFVNSGFLD